MLRYDFSISHEPGKNLTTADTLSRAPTGQPQTKDDELKQEARVFVNFVIESLPATEQKLDEIKQCQKDDHECQQIVLYCKQGWPEKKELLT